MLPSSLIAPFSSFPPTQTTGRFQTQNDLVLDTTSNLMWTRCLQGATWNGFTCDGKPTLYSWQQSQELAKKLNYAGYNDWRVPTLEELKSLAEKDTVAPKAAIPYLNQSVFPILNCRSLDSDGHSCWHWTSSRIDGSDHYAWIVYFGYGYGSANYETDAFALRLVRNHR